ncbi:hypothetical protein [Sphingobium sp. YR768]|uniref:hypothetical protein n=1 Tax=Sphingobium sp. YR768 TaxID=1884365 RepID=UPI0008BBA602|nr:hypothetical protein [Sphingobium sp. YR768]SES08112.1 hypothetical protein SAMN05518866_13716 [Sphingobium sp. YR768]
MIRAAILRWLGIPTRAETRAMILREIDADRAWLRDDDDIGPIRHRQRGEMRRYLAIESGKREDTRG